jgi:NTE family protein
MLRSVPFVRLPTGVRLTVPFRRRPAAPPPPDPDPDPGPVLVLSGGARLGAVQVGILRALSAAGFRPAAIVGTSSGALNGAFMAFHPEDRDLSRLRTVWEGIRFHRIFNRHPLHMLLNAVVRRDRVFDNAELRALVQRHVSPDEIAAAAIPLHIVATNLGTGEKAVFSSGSVTRALLASTAIPGLFPPVAIDGQLYVDGAVVAALDLDTAAALGARHIVAVDVSASMVPTHARSIGAVLARSLEIVLRDRTFGDFDRLGRRAHITLIRPGPLAMSRLGAITSMRALLDEADRLGEELVARALDGRGRLAHGLFSTEPPAPLPALAPLA